MSHARFQKQEREKNRRERAAAKLVRRVERGDGAPAQPEPADDQTMVLAELANLHERFDAGLVEFDDFEAAKRELTTHLDVR